MEITPNSGKASRLFEDYGQALLQEVESRRLLTANPHKKDDVRRPLYPLAGLSTRSIKRNPQRFHAFLTSRPCNAASAGNHFDPNDLFLQRHFTDQAGYRYEQPHRQQRTNRSQDQPIDLPCRGRTAAAASAPGRIRSALPIGTFDGRTAQAGRQRPPNAPELGPIAGIGRRAAAIWCNKRVAFWDGSGEKPACFQSPIFRSGLPDGF
jgi:hypothetical protein